MKFYDSLYKLRRKFYDFLEVSYFNSFFSATREMIISHSVAPGPDYIHLKWTHPNFRPEKYKLKYVCTLKPTCTPSHDINDYIMTNAQDLCSDTTSVTISDLHPSSNCMVFLIAVYNPASIDSGITITGTTLDEDTRKINPGLSYSWIALVYWFCIPFI